MNGAGVKMKGHECGVSWESGATASSSPFSNLQGRGRSGEGVEPERRPRAGARTSRSAGLHRPSKGVEDARGRAWPARKYAKGRGHGGGRRLPFSLERREGIYLGKGKREVVTPWGWAREKPDVMGREACSLSRRDGWGLETKVEGDANVGACQRRFHCPVDRIFGQGGTSSTATSRTNWGASAGSTC